MEKIERLRVLSNYILYSRNEEERNSFNTDKYETVKETLRPT